MNDAVTESFPWPYRRIATEEAFSVPEVYEALRRWAARADPAEPDQDFWDFVFTQDTPGLRRVRRQLLDLDGERLEIMDANGVDVQLLSLTAPEPGAVVAPPITYILPATVAATAAPRLVGIGAKAFHESLTGSYSKALLIGVHAARFPIFPSVKPPNT